MRRAFWCLLAVLSAGAVGCNPIARDESSATEGGESRRADAVGPPPAWSSEMQGVADGGNRFACDLYAQLRAEQGNLFLSPYSVHAALAMTAAGAGGATRDQMVKALHLPADRDQGLAAGDLGRFYAHPRADYELSVANALWGQKGLPWRADFLALQKGRFGAGLHEADFQTSPDTERRRINKWVEDQTRDRVKNLFGERDITVQTRMVLANAIYFKGKWNDEFKKSMTKDAAPFRLGGGGTVPVPLMYRQGSYAYGEGNGFQLLALPYRGRELAMVVLLPREPDGLPAVERQLTAGALAGWIEKMTAEDVRVSVPRFKLEHRFEPTGRLRALGMTDAFDPAAADFTGMAAEKLFVSKVVHKAFVDVNEEGTEAAAATGVVMATPSAAPVRRVPKEFKADRPFLFLIRDVQHGTILFMGRVTNPKG